MRNGAKAQGETMENETKLDKAVDNIINTGNKELAKIALEILWVAYEAAKKREEQAKKEKE